ncbi:MAG: hypothetical protein LBD23_06555 [Oscillospiraceae bacterium]|nr:hypothetical protein [Oscillospiraceae bacterium]
MERKKLVRDVMREALTRMEDAARTEDEFIEVVKQWDHLDENRERRERYNESVRSEDLLQWSKKESHRSSKARKETETVLPMPLGHFYWKQILRGDFIDTIHDCPHELFEMVEDHDISKLLHDMNENQKEILYLSAVRAYSNTHIAYIRKQSNRNIRKTLALIKERLREKLAAIIREQIKRNSPYMTHEKREFLIWYDKQQVK